MISLSELHDLSGVLVDVALLIGAVAAVVKFRVFNVLGHRWRSELSCSHHELADSFVIFTADYTVHNTGQRPLRLKDVRIRLTGVRQEGALLVPDESRVHATRVMQLDDPAFKGMSELEAGERTIFTLRAKLPELDDAVFVLCDFSLGHKREPAGYRGFYVKPRPAAAAAGRIFE